MVQCANWRVCIPFFSHLASTSYIPLQYNKGADKEIYKWVVFSDWQFYFIYHVGS